MNRPNREDYADMTYAWHGDVEYDHKEYSKDLEKYCDCIEEENERLHAEINENILTINSVIRHQEKLQKANNRLCNMLEKKVRYTDYRYYWIAPQWKYWSFEEDGTEE